MAGMMGDRETRARVLPFALYMGFVLVADVLGRIGYVELRWLYPVKVGLVAVLLWCYRNAYSELRRPWPNVRQLLLAVIGGLLVFVLWIGLDSAWMQLGHSAGYDPRVDGHIDWPLALTRVAGAALVVPLMEELFWRSFLLRWIQQPAFLALAPRSLGLKPLIVSSILFGIEHNLWFAGVVAGLVYGYLYRHSESLWVPVLAHGVTNGVLAVWIITTGNWNYW
ncbi:CAAX prenyl protease-related protein [Duganella sp. LjRoot269]|jgi:CAAX prenyl protease-like protein|uniref:CAAX prenyl protease-related protein n=1 Tax=Duganella sp. LjRoot269 TaxID=3342305 RepID=UPI003ECE93DD